MDPATATLAAAGITTLGNFFGGLVGAGPAGSYVAPSDARFAYLNLEKFNPDSGAVSALQQAKTRMGQMKQNRLGYIQQKYNEQRAAGGIGGHQLAGALGLMGSQFAALTEQELQLDTRIAQEMDIRNQSQLQKLAAQQQAILTPSKDGKQKFGTEGQRLSDDYLAWTQYQQDGGNLNFEDWRAQQSGPNNQAAQDAWAAWQQSHPSSNMTFENWYSQIYGGGGSDQQGGFGGPNNGDPALINAYNLWKTYSSGGQNLSFQEWFDTIYQGPTPTPNPTPGGGGGGSTGGVGNAPVKDPLNVPPGPPQVKDPIQPQNAFAGPIIRPEDLVNKDAVVDPMVFPQYKKPEDKNVKIPLNDNLLALYKQGLVV